MSDEDLWSDAEFGAAVQAYLQMLGHEHRREPYQKAAISREYRDGPLAARSKQSFDYRMRNISAVLKDMGEPWLPGYVPAEHVGQPSSLRIRRAIEAVRAADSLADASPVWVDVDLAYEPYGKGTETFVLNSAPFVADSLRKDGLADSLRQAHFISQLEKLSAALGTFEVPVFVSWAGERRRMDKGCVGHAVALGWIDAPTDDSAAGWVKFVRLRRTLHGPHASAKPPGRRVWLKAFWGFDPARDGYLGFTRLGDRERFMRQHQPGDLVLIYGADAKETDLDDRRQALGFLECEPIPITDRERSSDEGWARKVAMDCQDRWNNAVPVRRAWRVERRIEVKHIASETYTHARARVIASQGELLTEDEAFLALQLPVVPVNVFGEAPLSEHAGAAAEQTMSKAFSPSKGFEPSFGPRQSDYTDGDTYLYLLVFKGDAALLLGRAVGSRIVVKVGLSNDPKGRCGDHNKTLPPAAVTRWRLSLTSKAFPSGADAKRAEDALKALFDQRFESLGGEFFLGKESDLESAFFEASRPAAFCIKGASRKGGA